MKAPLTPEQQAAWDNVLKACEAWGAVAPPSEASTEVPVIKPTLRHAAPENFRIGVNMMLDAGGSMPGKIPVIVLPIRPQDIRKYKNKRTATFLLRSIGVST